MSMGPASDSDDGPRERPFPVLMLACVLVVVLLAVGLWIVLPDNPLTVVLLAIVVLGAVFFGAWRILSMPQFSRSPERRPQPPNNDG